MAASRGDAEMLDSFFEKAAALLSDSGGQMDSLTFGRKWRSKYPLDDLDTYKRGETLASLLSSSPLFQVQSRRNTAMKTFTLSKGIFDDQQAPKAPPPAAFKDAQWEVEPPASTEESATDVEERTSSRGYSFAIVSTQETEPETTKTDADPESEDRPAQASKLMNIWSQAAAHADAGAGEQAEQGALELLREGGASPDAMPFTRLINEQARAAAAGDRHAIDRAFKVLDDMHEQDVQPNRLTYTALITACARSASAGSGVGAVHRGEEALVRMQSAGIRPDVVSYNALMDACAKATSSDSTEGLERGLALLDRMEAEGIRPNHITYNTLMHACARAATEASAWPMEQGRDLLRRMAAAAVSPDVVTYNALVDACARSGQGAKGVTAALEILGEMMQLGVQPDVVTYNTLINACARAAGAGDSSAFPEALQLLGQMEATGVKANVVTFNSLMTIIARAAAAGDIPDGGAAVSQGRQVVTMMLSAGLRPNVITCNALLTAVARASGGESDDDTEDDDVQAALELMASVDVRANSVTFQTVVEGLQQSERTRTAAKYLHALQLLKQAGVEVDGGVYNSLIDGCLRGDNTTVSEVLPLLEAMEEAGALPSTATFNSVLELAAQPNTGEDAVVEAVKVLELMWRNSVPLNAASEAAVEAVRGRVEAETGLMNNHYAQKYYKSEEELWEETEIADWIEIIDGDKEWEERRGQV